jgi:hypothetical protein
MLHNHCSNPFSFLPEFRFLGVLPPSGIPIQYRPAGAWIIFNGPRTTGALSSQIVISPSLLQTRSQCFQSHPVPFFSLSRCQSFVLNTIQALFTKTGGRG